jgi:TonB family protein
MGQKIIKDFIKTHIDYPNKSFKNKTQGIVSIKFTTDTKGNVTEYHIVKSVSHEIDSSAISLFKLVLWKPATALGKPVIGSSVFEIKYNIKNFKNIVKRRGYEHIAIPFSPVDTSNSIYTLKQLDTIPTAILSPEVKSLSQYIYNNLTYPEAASKLGISGEVSLIFIVEVNGLPSNIISEKYLGGGCTEEAIRLVESIKWHPAVEKNKAVRAYYKLHINFKKNKARDGQIPNQQGSGI